MNNKCPRCGANMVVKPPAEIYVTNPPKYRVILWCGCGHQEDHGIQSAPTEQQTLLNRWRQANP